VREAAKAITTHREREPYCCNTADNLLSWPETLCRVSDSTSQRLGLLVSDARRRAGKSY
jgi:hypothetical protein